MTAAPQQAEGRYLLDTFAVIALLSAPRRLSADSRRSIGGAGVRLYASPASFWEIEIKVATGKLERPAADLVRSSRARGWIELPISAEHAVRAGRLPALHRDPFDRMIIAQGLAEDLTIVTPDALFEPYGVRVLMC